MEKNINRLISLYLLSMQDYERVTKYLPMNKALCDFNLSNVTAVHSVQIEEKDGVAIDVRMMLQRKYFQNGERLKLRDLIASAKEAGILEPSVANSYVERIVEMNNRPFEVFLSDGTLIKEKYKIVEDAIYGTLLHGDEDRALRVNLMPSDMRLLSLASFVNEREKVLYSFRDLCVEAGIAPLKADHAKRASVVREGAHSESEQSISGSPFWSGVIGRDATEEDMGNIISGNTVDDDLVLLQALRFFGLLRSAPVDKRALRKMIWRRNWLAWGDFSHVTNALSTVEHPGFSSRVMHKGGDRYAQVKVFPKVIKPWVTETPQLLSDFACIICLTKRKGVWKINRIVLPKRER